VSVVVPRNGPTAVTAQLTEAEIVHMKEQDVRTINHLALASDASREPNPRMAMTSTTDWGLPRRNRRGPIGE